MPFNWRVFIQNVLSSTYPYVQRQIEEVIDAYFLEKVEKKRQDLEWEAKIEPYASLYEKTLATALEVYDGKTVEVGFTFCPHCREAYEKLHDNIIKGKAEVIWADYDPLGTAILRSFDVNAVPFLFRVKKIAPGKVVVITNEGKKYLVRDIIPIGKSTKPMKKVKVVEGKTVENV